MKSKFKDAITAKSRQEKRLIVILNDGIINFLIFYSLSIFFNGSFLLDLPFILFQSFIIINFYSLKIYDNVIKHIGSDYIYRLLFSLALPNFLYLIYLENFSSTGNNLELILSNFFISLSLISLSRNVAKTLLYKNTLPRENIALYIDKDFNTSLIDNISSLSQYSPIAIINDNQDDHGLIINGLKVYSPSDISYLVREKNLKKLFITSQKNILNLKKVILHQLSNNPLKIIEIPNVNDFIEENSIVDSLNDLSLEDLIGKRKYDLKIDTIKNNHLKGKNILITGAGGSIGSILSEQLASYKPDSIILVDHSESSLFQVQQKLIINYTNLKIIAKPIDLSDKLLLEDLFNSHDVDIVYHAAAYKHVNLLEENILPAVKNNIFGLFNLINLCENHNVENFVLVSTDKAVKPTTVMGMTKKFCEQMIFNFKENTNCKYSAVRFGNVFNSSGSVIPIFKKQINEDRVVTVTDKNVTRYFMSIDEAVHLVIRSSFISKGNEIFILDMGEPQKIYDIAKQMIHLSGFSIKSKENPDGEVEIKITGLGSSEKLHEELTEFGYEKTIEKKIFVSKDSEIKKINFNQEIVKLENLLNNSDKDQILNFLRKI